MSRTTVATFGPGSMESLELKVWTKRRVGDMRQIRASLKGTYYVYCGMGYEHTHEVNETDGAWDGERDSYALDVIGARDGDLDATERLAQFMLDGSLEDWSDPCQDIDEVA